MIYDNACALARYSRHLIRCNRTTTAKQICDLKFVLDSFHVANHTACIDPKHPQYLWEVIRANHPDLTDVNTQTCEQLFSWLDGFVKPVRYMRPVVMKIYVFLLLHFYNKYIVSESRSNPNDPNSRPDRKKVRVKVKSTADNSFSNRTSLVELRRNPHRVGAFGFGKFHWCDPARSGKACGHVAVDSLVEELRVASDNIVREECVGFVVQHASGRYEVCSHCYHNLCRAGYLPKK